MEYFSLSFFPISSSLSSISFVVAKIQKGLGVEYCVSYSYNGVMFLGFLAWCLDYLSCILVFMALPPLKRALLSTAVRFYIFDPTSLHCLSGQVASEGLFSTTFWFAYWGNLEDS